MGPKKRKVTSGEVAIPEAFREEFECPVCLESITDPPIFMCENSQGHSVCAKCHGDLRKRGRKCPVCREALGERRNLTMEKMVARLPKVSCKFTHRFCGFKNTSQANVKKHEVTCQHRDIPCAYCNAKIGTQGMLHHVQNVHMQGFATIAEGFSVFIHTFIPTWFKTKKKYQYSHRVYVPKDNGNRALTEFMINWCVKDEADGHATLMFWVSNVSLSVPATNYKYTLKVQKRVNSNEFRDDYVFEGTRYCVPCDLSHEDVKKKRCALTLDQELVKENTQGMSGRLNYALSIQKVA